MANKDNIKGITIQIGGDTTGLSKALEGVNKKIRTTQDELREVNYALKLDPTNVDLLRQKQELLAKAVTETSEKLDKLKDAQAQAAEQLANKKIGQEQYDALTREIVKTEAALKKATKAQDDFNAKTALLSASLDGVSQKADSVAKATRGLSTAAAGLGIAIAGAAVKSAAYADDLNTLSKQTGISTEDLQKMKFAADEIDVSVDDIAGSTAKLRRAMASDSSASAEAFSRIGVSVRDSSGQLRDSSTVFYEVLEGLSRVGNETERDALAMELFGRNADQLAGIIDDGGAQLKALGEEAENLGLILDQDTLDAMNKVNDQIDRLKATAVASFAKAGANALEALSPIIEGVVTALSNLLNIIGNIPPEVLGAAAIIAGIVASISPIAGLISNITGAVSSFLRFLPQIQSAFAAITSFAAANPTVLIIAGIVALVAAIIANWDKIKPILDAVWNKVKEVFDKIADIVKSAIDKVKSIIEAVRDFFVGIWELIVDTAKAKINTVIDFINKAIEAVNNFTSKINNSGIGKFFGINIGQISTIPALAGGGVLQNGSALVGERGPELLTMQNGAAQVQPLTTTTNTYNTFNQTSRQPVQINLVLDGMVAARALYDPLKTVSSQRGPAFVK